MQKVSRSLLEKMGIKNEMKAIFVGKRNELPEELSAIKTSSRLTGSFDYIHVFSKNQSDLANHFSRLQTHLKPSGMLWVSWPKSRQLGTDLDIKSVIRIGYEHHFLESKAISINKLDLVGFKVHSSDTWKNLQQQLWKAEAKGRMTR